MVTTTATVQGSNPADPIIGDSSNNVLEPLASGSFTLIGEAGADKFVFSVDEKFNKKNADVILDFNAAEGDVIGLSADVFSELDRIKLKTVSTKSKLRKAQQSKASLVYFEGEGQVFYNANGSDNGWGKKGGQFAALEAQPDLFRSSFEIV